MKDIACCQKDKVKSVQLVPDLIRDKKGKPIIDKETGEPKGVHFRKRTEQEIQQSPDKYIAKSDYLEYMNMKRIEYGYKDGNNIVSQTANLIKTLQHEGKIEGETTIKNTRANFMNTIKNIFKRMTQVKIDENADKKIERVMDEFTFDRKNPYRDEKFGKAVAKFQQQGLTQLDLKTELENLTNSSEGAYLNIKEANVDKSVIRKNGIHGIGYNNRVAIHTMLIAKNEGLLENDTNNRIKDILISAAYYHDIGRIGNIGPHSKRSARKLDKVGLKYLNGMPYSETDKNLLKLIVEGHEGKDSNFDKLAKKYKIPEEEQDLAKKMLHVIKDADALDRVRIDLNTPFSMKTDLNPNYLRTDTSKRLLNASYELENLTQKVKFENVLVYNTEGQKEEKKDRMQIAKENFENSLKVDLSKIPQIPQKAKKTLILSKEKMSYVGNNIKEKIGKIMENRANKENINNKRTNEADFER